MFIDSFSAETFKGTQWTVPYRLRLPEDYTIEKKYPVVLFFHGAGERGDDNMMQLAIGVPTAMEDKDSPLYHAIVVAPQCPKEKQWVDTPWYFGCYDASDVPETVYMQTALELLDDLFKKYSCDKTRVYAMGISMGGFGVWDLLARHGARFAAGFACCGAGDPRKAELLRDIPIWAYHGALDSVVPPSGSRDMVAAIEAAGGKKIHYREFPALDHCSWNDAYACYDDIRDMFAQTNVR